MIDLANRFSKMKTLSRNFLKWLYILNVKREQKLLTLEHEKNKKKMELFMEQLKQKNAQQQLQQQQQELQQLQQALTPSPLLPDNSSNAQPVTPVDSNTKKKLKDKTSPEKDKAPPKFLQTMEERSKQRKERREQLQRKYKTIEEEKEKQKDEEQLRVLAEEQAKKDEKKREKMLQKQREIEMEQEKIAMKNKGIKAREHYEKSIVKFYGFLPWKKLLRVRGFLEKRAEDHYRMLLKRKVFESIRHCKYVNYNTITIHQCASVALLKGHCNKHLLKKLFIQWCNQLTLAQRKFDKSVQYHNQVIVKRQFLNWKRICRHEREMKELQEIEQERKARAFSIRFSKRFYLSRWKQIIEEAHATKEKEQIGNILREKVKQWLQEYRFQNAIEWI